MFRDTSEELARLEAELLAEEEPAEEELCDEEEEDFEEDLLDDDLFAPDEEEEEETAYYPNYASGYRAYNTDVTDEDLDAYSEEVRQGKQSGVPVFLVLLILLLTLGILALVYLFLGKWGLL